tara:strand:+ start:680 stop:925 length:246 start_codon:yes stop_codon:yes gene_type:complete
MAQFIIGFAAGVYIGTHYNCKPGLSYASQTFEQYCPKRNEGDKNHVPIDGINIENNAKEVEAEKKVKEKANEITSKFKKWF